MLRSVTSMETTEATATPSTDTIAAPTIRVLAGARLQPRAALIGPIKAKAQDKRNAAQRE